MKRNGDWRDVLFSYTYAVDGKKLWTGLVAVVLNVLLLVFLAYFHREVICSGGVVAGVAGAEDGVGVALGSSVAELLSADGAMGVGESIRFLLNPFAAGLAHFALSIFGWLLVLFINSGRGGVIARLTALEYARDELPTLADGTAMVKGRRIDFFLAPVTPLAGIVLLWLCLLLGGLVVSIPYVGPVMMVLGYPLCILVGMLMVFLIIVGLWSFGLMMSAMAANGKSAFDGWTSAYTYVLWGFGRFVLYGAICAIVGGIGFSLSMRVVHLLFNVVHSSIDMGSIGGDWSMFASHGDWTTGGTDTGFTKAMMAVVYVMYLFVSLIPFAFLYTYYFSSQTIVYLLLRKHVDNIDMDVVCPAVPERAAHAAEPDEEPGEEPQAGEGDGEDEDVLAPAEAALEEEPPDEPEPEPEPAEDDAPAAEVEEPDEEEPEEERE